MATLEKPKQKKSKNVPSKSNNSKTSVNKENFAESVNINKRENVEKEIETAASSSTIQSTSNSNEKENGTKNVHDISSVENIVFGNERLKLLPELTCIGDQNNLENIVNDVEDEKNNVEEDITCDINSDVKLEDNKVFLPSAPLVVDHVKPEIVIYPKLPSKELTECVKFEKVEEILTENIKPFTVAQLAALYNNPELTASKQFISHFVDNELRRINASQHPLYELLTNYLHAREKLQENSLELNQLKNDYKSCQNQLWNLETAKITSKAQCQDGTNVSASHEYKTAKFQKSLLDNLIHIQNKIKILANETHILQSYTTSLLKLKIDHYMSAMQLSCLKAMGISIGRSDIPVTLKIDAATITMQAHLQELRLCISVLFAYQRRLYKDREFVHEIRAWLTDAVALLLRLADWQDHHYLLNQVLRCPAGIGTWAASFIQIPVPSANCLIDTPFSNRFINHIVAVLSVLLCPIEKRDAFLEQILTTLQEPHDAVTENLWVLVDSDGEEDEDNSYGVSALKENDLVALLNQIPMADLFRAVLFVRQQDGSDIWTGEGDTHHMLRLLSFCTVLVQLYAQGLITYNAPRYHQFAKRLCRLIRQIVQYTSDTWEVHRDILSSASHRYDMAMNERLQTEFDAFFLRATLCLYRAQKLGAWQFLAIAPFHTISIHTLWRFFYILHQGVDNQCDDNYVQDLAKDIDFKSLLSDASARQHFCERLCIMSVEESYYLLNTFANMIMARPASDEEFIQFATLNLLQIGFSGDTESQESSCKCAGILLSNITVRYPFLISDILLLVKNSVNDLNQIIFLFSELPLHLWCPTEKDIDIITIWLLQNPITSVESYVARKILSNLNWNISSDDELFLPLSLHRRIALLVVEAVERHAASADIIGFLDGVKQAVGQQSPPEQSLTRWAWQLVYQLRLHSSSRRTNSVRGIPELVELDIIQRCIREKQSLACYVALSMTAVGHLLPLVCSHGLALLETLIAANKFDAVLIAMYQIIPLFVDCAETLLMCTSFQSVIYNLLAADRTYMKMAKSIIITEFPGTVLLHFGNMIVSQIHNPRCHPLMEFWVKTLVSVPNWNKDAGILYLLNIIARTAFFIPEKYRVIGDVFKELLEKATDRNNGSNLSLLSWVPLVGSSSAVGSALLLGPNAGTSELWLFYLITSLEHQHVELRTGLWPELLRQLYVLTGKTNVDSTLKKAANAVKVPTFTSTGLCLYRWAQQALDTPLEHPLLPLIWQRFFSLYLARVSFDPGNTENHGSVGSKFFDGMVNTSYCKKLKKRLQETVEFYKRKLNPETENDDDNLRDEFRRNKELEQRCVAIFSAYVLWLEEPLLQETTLYLPSLPPQYEPRYLSHIIQNSTSPWLEFVNCELIRSEYEKSRNEWDILCCQNIKKSQRTPLQKMGGSEEKNPIERILRRLNSYDKPLPAPPLKQTAFIIPTFSLQIGDSVSSTLQPHLKKLQQFAEIYSLQISEHGALDCQYRELVQQLYTNFQTKITMKKTCKPTCSGAAVISVTFCEARPNESVKHQMQTNRTNFSTLLSHTLQRPIHSMCINCASLEHTVDLLQQRLQDCIRLADSVNDNQTRMIGVDFFYFLLSSYNEELKAYPPTQQLYNTCLDKLGQSFLCGVERETVRLVKTIVQQPNKGNLLTPHFVAVNLSTNIFLQLYADICDCLDHIPDIAFTLLSKFNIQSWLTNKNPKLAERSKFIQLLFQSLTRLGPKPNKQQYTLHEIFQRHLLIIFRHHFPEHYGEILMLVLQHSASQSLAVSVWTDILNALAQPASLESLFDHLQVKEFMRLHARRQRMLGARELAETVALLGRYFAHERLQFGLYGLYPKYRAYIEQLCLLLGMTLHALVVATVEQYGGALLADILLTDHLWPRILEAFSPWLIPYSVNDCKDATANWIQQLTDDRAVLLPWIQADIPSAQKLFNIFVNCIAFIGDTLPACTHLLCYVWQFYSINFAHSTVKEHVWTVVHNSLKLIQWEQFWPTLSDLEMMLKVMEQYLPECHIFLGHVFLEINWPLWIARLVQGRNTVAIERAHHCLLHLFVKISREPSVRQSDKIRILLERAHDFSWTVLDISTLEQALDWYVMSCDPRIALPLDPAVKQIDYIVFGLLRVVACYDSTVQPVNLIIVKKRQCFIRTYIKLLVNCSSRHKTILSTKPQQFSVALTNQLDHMELIIGSGHDTVNQGNILVSEFLQILNNSCLCTTALKCVEKWLETRTAASEVLRAVLRTASFTISSAESTGALLESALSAYFTPSVSEGSIATWVKAVELFTIGPPRQPPLEQTLINSGRLLTLNTLLLNIIASCKDRSAIEELLDTVVGWLTLVKANDTIENKLPLLWTQVIRLALRVCHEGNEEKASVSLRKFVHNHLLLVAENRSGHSGGSGWGRGFLGAIGLSKQGIVSPQGRFLCRAIAGYILAQLPEPRGDPPKVRCFAGASRPVGQSGGNSECAKILLKLDVGVSELKPHIELTLKQIQDPQNSLHNAESFLVGLIDKLYSKAYLKML